MDNASNKRAKGKKPPSPEDELKAATLRGRGLIAGRRVIPALHPAFILRADTWHPVFKLDIARAVRLANNPGMALEDAGTHLVGGLEVLEGLGDVVSCDIETTGINPLTCDILCVGLSDGLRTVVIWPWRDDYAPAFSAWLRTRKAVVGHNFI